jgi:hypothetical protein
MAKISEQSNALDLLFSTLSEEEHQQIESILKKVLLQAKKMASV